MDTPDLDARERQEALLGLDRLARWPGQRAPLLGALERLLGRPQAGTRKLVELGAGSGSLSRWMARELAQRGHRVEVQATDLNPGEGVSSLDVLAPSLPEADIYFSNLLLHHLDDAVLPGMLARQAAASRLGLAHYDLHRHWAHLQAARLILWCSRMPDIVRQDGSLSIRQGFSRAELLALVRDLPGAQVAWHPPFRWLLTWHRP